jgi:hypothetical protein
MCSPLVASSLLATSPPMYPPQYRANTVAYSSDRRFCVEIHEPGGIGGCLAPKPFIAQVASNPKLMLELAAFDYRHRTLVLFRQNDRGSYVRLWELQTQPPERVVLSLRGDVLLTPSQDRSGPRSDHVYHPDQAVEVVDVTGRRVAQIRLDTLLTNTDIQRLESPRWSVRIHGKNNHRILVLAFDVVPMRVPFSSHKERIEKVEYDIDQHTLLVPKRNRY